MTRLRGRIGLACVFAAISLPASAASSLWSVGGPGGGSISVLAMDPQHATTIYAGTADGGIWKTTDATAHWTPALAGLPMFAGHPLPINAIAVDPTVASRAYAATNRGLFKTDDGGTSWTQTGASVLEGFLNVIGINPTSSSTVFVGTSSGIFVSADAGANWSPSNTGLVDGQGQTPTVLSLLINPDVSSSMIAGTRDAGTFLSTDGGQSWKKFGGTALDGVDVTGLVVDPENIASVYALSPELGVFRTAPPSNATVSAIVRDEGENDWESLLDDLFLDVFEEEICGGSPCFAEFLLLYFFSPTSAAAPAPFASGNLPEFMVGTSGLGIFHSIDGGATFTAINDGLPSFGVSAIAGVGSSSTRYAGFGGAGVAKTTDDAHWTTANNGLLASEVGAVAVAPSSPTIVYAVTGSSIFKSFDAGVSWQNLTSIGIDQQLFPALAVDPTNSSIVYAASDEKGVIKTSNGGSSWSASNTGISTTGVDSFAIVFCLARDRLCRYRQRNLQEHGRGGALDTLQPRRVAADGALSCDRSHERPDDVRRNRRGDLPVDRRRRALERRQRRIGFVPRGPDPRDRNRSGGAHARVPRDGERRLEEHRWRIDLDGDRFRHPVDVRAAELSGDRDRAGIEDRRGRGRRSDRPGQRRVPVDGRRRDLDGDRARADERQCRGARRFRRVEPDSLCRHGRRRRVPVACRATAPSAGDAQDHSGAPRAPAKGSAAQDAVNAES